MPTSDRSARPMVDPIEVRVSAPDADVADRLARTLVEQRLAACVQVVPGVRSTYRWAGAVESTDEVLLLAKTTVAHFPALAAAVRAAHPYDVPEILAVPIAHIDPPYAAWLASVLTPPGSTDR